MILVTEVTVTTEVGIRIEFIIIKERTSKKYVKKNKKKTEGENYMTLLAG